MLPRLLQGSQLSPSSDSGPRHATKQTTAITLLEVLERTFPGEIISGCIGEVNSNANANLPWELPGGDGIHRTEAYPEVFTDSKSSVQDLTVVKLGKGIPLAIILDLVYTFLRSLALPLFCTRPRA